MQKLFDALSVKKQDGGLLATVYFFFFANGLMAIFLGSVLPYIREEYGLDYTTSGFLLSAHSAGNLCMVFLAGILAYIFGRKRVSIVLGSLAVVGFVMMTLTGNAALLVIAFVLTGISRGTYSNSANSAVAAISGKKGIALNILHAAFALGALLSPLLLMLGDSIGMGWRFAVYCVAAIGLASVLLIARSTMDKIQEMPRQKGGALHFLRDIPFWINCCILFFYLCAESSITGWFVSYFRDTGQFSATVAGLTPTLLWIMIMIGRIVCALLANRVNRAKMVLALSIAFSLFFLGLLISPAAPLRIVCLLGIGLSLAGIYPTTMSTISYASSPLATGFIIGFASIGGMIMPGVVGIVADAHGLTWGIATILAACAMMVLFAIIKIAWEKA